MAGIDNRDDKTYLADVRRLGKTLMKLLDRKKPEEAVAHKRSGSIVEITPPLSDAKPPRPRSRLSTIALGAGRDMRLLTELPDYEIIKLAKRGGRILRSGDVSKVRSSAGEDGQAADIISAMDANGLFDS